MKLNFPLPFNCVSYLWLEIRNWIFLFLFFGFFSTQAQIFISGETTFVVKEGTIISKASYNPSDSVTKSEKLKIYVKSESAVDKIADADNYEIVYPKNSDSKIVKNVSSKTPSEKEPVKTHPKEEIPETHQFASFPVPKSCISNSDGSIDAIVRGSQWVKKIGVNSTTILDKIQMETTSDLKQNYFLNINVSSENSNADSIRPPPFLS